MQNSSSCTHHFYPNQINQFSPYKNKQEITYFPLKDSCNKDTRIASKISAGYEAWTISFMLNCSCKLLFKAREGEWQPAKKETDTPKFSLDARQWSVITGSGVSNIFQRLSSPSVQGPCSEQLHRVSRFKGSSSFYLILLSNISITDQVSRRQTICTARPCCFSLHE